ncbi:rhomboid family intramembrane serine protease [Siphonobacter aquaeclarae]|jgi:membrane associated rhomboid family serine protease|uniref:Rhomboid family protein n=1 Tax=Siphonobacter aquaeclarae TaxID=563176 RepID=A0A1G9MBF1_9BACT|nr:rhomboid family intramembrane serine protease [Siphonobacter aquaeclarae]MBO9637467.1 rhomboid family intramembrane serine protease [Siphonobacter aquaeclarae]SDL71600.1 Rhomboid family protein [Siphonobacter aquaeclarae]
MFNLTPAVRAILLANVALFAAESLVFPNLGNLLGLHNFESPLFLPFQFVTHMFMHGGFGHLFSNMFALIMFGPGLENLWGTKRFTFFYFFTGIGAGLLYSGVNYYEIGQIKDAALAFVQDPDPTNFAGFMNDYAPLLQNEPLIQRYLSNPDNVMLQKQVVLLTREYVNMVVNIPMVGASGAIFGILMAFGMLFPNTLLFLLFIPFPIKAKYFVALYGLYELYSGLHQNPGDNVAHFAHVGGMLFAFILIRYWARQRKNFY